MATFCTCWGPYLVFIIEFEINVAISEENINELYETVSCERDDGSPAK